MTDVKFDGIRVLPVPPIREVSGTPLEDFSNNFLYKRDVEVRRGDQVNRFSLFHVEAAFPHTISHSDPYHHTMLVACLHGEHGLENTDWQTVLNTEELRHEFFKEYLQLRSMFEEKHENRIVCGLHLSFPEQVSESDKMKCGYTFQKPTCLASVHTPHAYFLNTIDVDASLYKTAKGDSPEEMTKLVKILNLAGEAAIQVFNTDIQQVLIEKHDGHYVGLHMGVSPDGTEQILTAYRYLNMEKAIDAAMALHEKVKDRWIQGTCDLSPIITQMVSEPKHVPSNIPPEITSQLPVLSKEFVADSYLIYDWYHSGVVIPFCSGLSALEVVKNQVISRDAYQAHQSRRLST